jgi:hypothetical protein
MACSWGSRAIADSLRRSARELGRGDCVRVDAAVARQGLRAAGGAQARNVPPASPVGDGRQLRRARVSVIPCASLTKIGERPRQRRASRALEDVEKVLTRSG